MSDNLTETSTFLPEIVMNLLCDHDSETKKITVLNSSLSELEEKDDQGLTPLMYVMSLWAKEKLSSQKYDQAGEFYNSRIIMDALVSKGVNVNETDNNLQNVLHHAVRLEFKEGVEWCIQNDVSSLTRDCNGLTPFDYAYQKINEEYVWQDDENNLPRLVKNPAKTEENKAIADLLRKVVLGERNYQFSKFKKTAVLDYLKCPEGFEEAERLGILANLFQKLTISQGKQVCKSLDEEYNQRMQKMDQEILNYAKDVNDPELNQALSSLLQKENIKEQLFSMFLKSKQQDK